MADHRSVSDRYARIGAELVETEELLAAIRRSEATIVYLASDAAKATRGRKVLGQCERVPDRWRWAVPADFCITVFEPNVSGMTDDQLSVLILHELLHVGVSTNKDGDEVYRTVPHDLEDFREIVERFGMGFIGGRWEFPGPQFVREVPYEVRTGRKGYAESTRNASERACFPFVLRTCRKGSAARTGMPV